jgi:hypothetical protein
MTLIAQDAPQGKRFRKQRAAIRAELSADSCSALGITAFGPVPVLALCRLLVEAGHNPAIQLEVLRDDVQCLRVRSIGEGARLTVEDNRLGQPTIRRWRNRPAGDGAASPMRSCETGSQS